MTSRARRCAPAALVVVVILLVTLTPGSGTRAISPLCLLCGSRGLADALLNVALFVPLGAALARCDRRTVRPFLAVAAFSTTLELAQTLIPGRYPVAGDVAFNALGGAVGVLVWRAGTGWPKPRRVRRAAAWAGAALFPALVAAATAWLLEPSFPASTYFGQRTADLGHLEPYDGRVLTASVGELELPEGRIGRSDYLRALLRGGAPLRFAFVVAPPPRGLAPIVSIYDDLQREIILVGLDRRDVVLRYRTRAARYRLDQPDLRVPGGVRELPLVGTVEMAVRRGESGWCLASSPPLDGAGERCALRHAVGRGWSLLLYPEELGGRWGEWLDLAWMALLGLPLGLWGGRPWAVAAGALPTLAAIFFVPTVSTVAAFSGWSAAGWVIGVAGGSGLGRRLTEVGSSRRAANRASEGSPRGPTTGRERP